MKKHGWISRNFFFMTAVLAATSCSRVSPESNAPERTDPSLACYLKSPLSFTGAFPEFYDKLDIFAYDADFPCLLDSYCTADFADCVEFSSRGGEKEIIAVAGADVSSLPYRCFDSLDSFAQMQYSLSDENPSKPLCVAHKRVRVGAGARVSLYLTPLMCKLRLLPVKVDFSSRPYSGETLTEVKAYLINVAARTFLLDGNDSTETEVLNCGRYDAAACAGLSHPDILYSADALSGATFFCYPRKVHRDRPSVIRPTKLVVEGKIAGHSYYYPIEVASGDMHRGGCYTYEITIKRAGSLDPDEPADAASFSLRTTAEPWEEYENAYVYY